MGMLLKRHRRNGNGEEKRKSETGREERQEIKEEQVNYQSLTVPELKEIAKKRDIEGYSEMKKAEIIKKLEG